MQNKIGRPTLKETQGESNIKVSVYLPQSVYKAMEKDGKRQAKIKSVPTLLSELACEKYGKNKEKL